MRKSFLLTVNFGRHPDGSISLSESFQISGESVKIVKERAKEIIKKLALEDYKVSLSAFRDNHLKHYFNNYYQP